MASGLPLDNSPPMEPSRLVDNSSPSSSPLSGDIVSPTSTSIAPCQPPHIDRPTSCLNDYIYK